MGIGCGFRLNPKSQGSLCDPDLVTALNNYKGSMTPFASTILLLLGEMHAMESKFKNYISVLPTSAPDCLVGWLQDELKDLKGVRTIIVESGIAKSMDLYPTGLSSID